MDKRILKTRTAVFNAVFDLTTQQEQRKITVLDICNKAGINKSTFYLHYNSLEDCISKCFNFVMDEMINFCKTIKYDELLNNPEESIRIILDEIEKDVTYLYRYKNSAIYSQSTKLLKENIVQSIIEANHFNINDHYKEIVTIIFFVGGTIDAFVQPLPNFNRELLTEVMTEMIKRNN